MSQATASSADLEGPALVQSVDRALTILEALADAGGELGITELAAQLDVHKSTASRLIATLEAHDLVEQQQDRGKYRLGLGLLRLSARANLGVDLVRIARPALQRLVEVTGETGNLAVTSGEAALYIDQLAGSFALQAHSWVGQAIPLHATSNGKILLAFGEPTLLDMVLEHGLQGYGPATITQGAQLREEVARVREQGWASARDELEEGLTAVASPVFDAAGVAVGSLSISGPSFRVDDRLEELLGAVVEAGRQASSRLGYVPA